MRPGCNSFSGGLGVDVTFLLLGAGAAVSVGLALSAWLRGKKKPPEEAPK